MKRIPTRCLVIVFIFIAHAFCKAADRTPAEWVTRLGADHLPEREEASAALLKLGPAARDVVREALNSRDAEIQYRAQELWKSLRWAVVPDAIEETNALVEEGQTGRTNREHWRDFVKKHGARSIFLALEFYTEKLKGYEQARYAIIEDADPAQVAQVIAQSGDQRNALLAMIEDLQPEKTSRKTAVNFMKIEIALWRYEQAFHFGSDAWIRLGAGSNASEDELLQECVAAADRGKLGDQLVEMARNDIAAETDNAKLWKKLGFYAGLLVSRDKSSEIGALVDSAKNLDASHATITQLRPLVEKCMQAHLYPTALKLLGGAPGPAGFYMRSVIESRMHTEQAASEDWKAMLASLSTLEKEKDATLFELGELMRDWKDTRAVTVFEKILTLEDMQPVYGANACFRLGDIAEENREYAKAADYFEKGLAYMEKSGGILIAQDKHGNSEVSGQDFIHKRIKELRARAAGGTPAPAASQETPAPM